MISPTKTLLLQRISLNEQVYLHFQLELSTVIQMWVILIHVQETTEDSMAGLQSKFQNLNIKVNQMLKTDGQTSSIHIQNKSCWKTTKFAERQQNLKSNI